MRTPSSPPRRPEKLRLAGVMLLAVFFSLNLGALGVLSYQTSGATSGSLTVAKIFILLALLCWVIRVLLRREIAPLRLLFSNHVHYAAVGYFFLTSLSVVNARDFSSFFEIFIKTLSLVVFYFLIISVVGTSKKVHKACLSALLIGGVINGMAGLYELTTGQKVISRSIGGVAGMAPRLANEYKVEELIGEEGVYQRIEGLSGDPGFHAFHNVILTGLASSLPFAARSLRGKLGTALLVLLYMMNIFGTGSRINLAGMIAALGVSFLLVKARHKWIVIAVAGVFAVVVLGVTGESLNINERIFGTTAKGNKSVENREKEIKVALHILKADQRLVVGIGSGNYLGQYLRYAPHVPGAMPLPQSLHMSYLLLLVENGLIGLGAFLLFLVTAGVQLLQVRRETHDPYVRALAIGGLAAFCGWAVVMVGYHYYDDEFGWLTLGLATALVHVHRAQGMR